MKPRLKEKVVVIVVIRCELSMILVWTPRNHANASNLGSQTQSYRYTRESPERVFLQKCRNSAELDTTRLPEGSIKGS
jgi:hypothetical protein